MLGIRTIRLAIASLALFSLAACGEDAQDPTTLHRGNTDEPLTLDPHKAVLQVEIAILNDLFEGLYRYEADGAVSPGLAREVDVSADGLVWTITMRESAWSDGEPVTAHDFVAGLRRFVDPETFNELASSAGHIANATEIIAGELPPEALGVTALDDLTIEFRLDYPAPYMPDFLAGSAWPLPRHTVDRLGDAWVQPGEMVSNGPYQLSEWRSRDFIRLTANAHHRDAGELCFADVYYYPTVDRASAQRRVRSGELDLNPNIDGASLEFLRENEAEMLHASPSTTAEDIMFNVSAPPFDDVRVRQAFTMAIDRRFLAEEVLGGASAPNWRMLSPDLPGAPPGPALPYADQDMESRRAEARRLLEAAGYGPDNPFSATFRHTPSFGRVVPVLLQHWSMIAPWVSIDLEQNDTQIHYSWMRAGDFQFAQSSWTPTLADPAGVLYLWASEAGEMNYSRWNSPEFDAVFNQGRASADPDERRRLMAQAEQILIDNVPHGPLAVPLNFNLVRPEITGWNANARRINSSRWLCREGLTPGAAMQAPAQ